MAKILLERKVQFDYNLEDEDWKPEQGRRPAATGELARKFFEYHEVVENDLSELDTSTGVGLDFSRMAASFDVEVSLDVQDDSGATISRYKGQSTIVYAAIMVANYGLRLGDYARMNLRLLKGVSFRPYLDNINAFFPLRRPPFF